LLSASYGGQTTRGPARPRLENAGQISVERSDGNEHDRRVHGRQLGQEIDVPRHKLVLGDDPDWISELHQDFEASTGQFQTPLDRLVRVGHSADVEDLRHPLGGRQLGSEELRGSPL
jgi:hypothetical protein